MKALCQTIFFVFLLLATLFFTTLSFASAHILVIDHFSGPVEPGELPPGWKALHFPGNPVHTQYKVVGEGDEFFLEARSRASASALYREVDVDLTEHPVLSWRWKVDGVLEKGDETRKEGDDYSARVYVIFEFEPEKTTFLERLKYRAVEAIYGVTPPGTTLNYIWANRLEKGGAVPNPFTEKAMMIAVESGDALAGQWVSEERNVYEDHLKYFGAPPPRVRGVAIMTDSDNTGGSATGWYDDIVFKRP